MTAYTIIERREVPAEIRSVGAVTRRVVVEIPNHAGQKAICIKTVSGFIAWGFGDCWEAAEADAASKAAEIAAMTIEWMVDESESAVEAMTAAQISAWKVSSYATTQGNEDLASQAKSAANAADNAAVLMRTLNLAARAVQEKTP